MLNLAPLEKEYMAIIAEAAGAQRPLAALVREWSQIQREVQDAAESGAFEPEDAERMLDRLFAEIDARLSLLAGEVQG